MGPGVWRWTASGQAQEAVGCFFPPKPLSVTWGSDKNDPEEPVTARASRRQRGCGAVWVCGQRTSARAARSRTEEKRSTRAFSSIQVGGGEGSRQAAHSKEEVNERGSQNYSPFIALKAPLRSFLEFHLLPPSAKLGLRKARETPRRAGRRAGGQGSWRGGEQGCTGEARLPLRAGRAPRPPTQPPPPAKPGQTWQKARPGHRRCAWGARGGRGRGIHARGRRSPAPAGGGVRAAARSRGSSASAGLPGGAGAGSPGAGPGGRQRGSTHGRRVRPGRVARGGAGAYLDSASRRARGRRARGPGGGGGRAARRAGRARPGPRRARARRARAPARAAAAAAAGGRGGRGRAARSGPRAGGGGGVERCRQRRGGGRRRRVWERRLHRRGRPRSSRSSAAGTERGSCV